MTNAFSARSSALYPNREIMRLMLRDTAEPELKGLRRIASPVFLEQIDEYASSYIATYNTFVRYAYGLDLVEPLTEMAMFFTIIAFDRDGVQPCKTISGKTVDGPIVMCGYLSSLLMPNINPVPQFKSRERFVVFKECFPERVFNITTAGSCIYGTTIKTPDLEYMSNKARERLAERNHQAIKEFINQGFAEKKKVTPLF